MREIIGNTTATPNPQSDWNQLDNTKPDYIKNKPASGEIFTTSIKDGVLVLEQSDAMCEKGDSAYEVACKNGFEGTEAEWLASLIGGGNSSAIELALTLNGNETNKAPSVSAVNEGIDIALENIRAAALGNIYTIYTPQIMECYIDIPDNALPYFYVESLYCVFSGESGEERVNAKTIIFKDNKYNNISTVSLSDSPYIKIPEGAVCFLVNTLDLSTTYGEWFSFVGGTIKFQVKVYV